MRRTMTAVALALLWAPSNQAFTLNNNGKTSMKVSTFPVSVSAGANDNFDWGALDRKNASRKKFGLKPMTPEEFLENDAQVQQLALQQEQEVAVMKAEAARNQKANSNSPQSPVPGFLNKIFGDVFPNTCESNVDCEAPKVCCDFGVSKVCCAGGPRQRSLYGELALVPVPVDVLLPSN